MSDQYHKLSPVATPEEWKTYHDIRRKILWENRGKLGEYQENHPDEFHPQNHPMLLYYKGTPVGVVRIDLEPEKGHAIMRKVAIVEDQQRLGHGRKLVELVEQFALENGCHFMVVSSAEDAVVFYEKCGYEARTPGSRQIIKVLK